jgi:FtsH-binding integral membrane protein
MPRMLGVLLLALHLALAVFALGVWLPGFFLANVDLKPEWSWRYVAATGLPYGLLLVVAVARQVQAGTASLLLFAQTTLAGALLVAAVICFERTPQANFFCAAHLLLCAFALLWNLARYDHERARQIAGVAAR